MLIEAFEQVKGSTFDPLHSATNGLTVQDEELLIAAARAGDDTPSNTAHVAAAGNGNLSGGNAGKNNERRSRENFDATLRQMTLDQLNKEWIENERAIAGLTREIDALDSEIAFLNQFQDEEDLLDENGQLRDDVKEYLRRKGRDPNQMDPSEAFLFMQGEEVSAHEVRDQKVEERSELEIYRESLEQHGVDPETLALETDVAVVERELEVVSSEMQGEITLQANSDVVAQATDNQTAASPAASTFDFG